MCGFSPRNTFREAHGKGMGVVDVVWWRRNFSPLVIGDMFNHAQKKGTSSSGALVLQHACVQSGARTASPCCWKPQPLPQARGAWPCPSAQLPMVLMVARHLFPPATPCLCLFQQDSRRWAREPFHTSYWGPQRASVRVGLSVALAAVDVRTRQLKYTYLWTHSKIAMTYLRSNCLW